MASLEDDYRFAKPRSSSISDDEEEEPLFGSTSSNLGGTSFYSDYIRRNVRGDSVDDDADYGKPSTARSGPRLNGHSQARDEDESQEHSELYAILNLDKDASKEDVLRAYRSLAVAFHPDKHRDEILKATAQHSFERVQRAYEILSDTHKRAVYDLLGEEGLKGDWQVGPKLKTQQEMQAEYEKHRLKRAQADIENLIRSRTEATVALDASPAIDASKNLLDTLLAIPQANIRQLFMKASTVSVLTPSTQLTYSGSMLARRGAGGGNFSITAKHQYSQKLGIEATTTLIEPRIVNAKANYAFSDTTFLTFDTAIRTPYAPPPFNVTYGTRIAESLTGFVKLSSGTSYSFLMPFSQTAPFPGSPSTLTAGVAGSGYSVDVTVNQFLETQLSGSYGNAPLFGSGKNGWRCSVNSGINSSGIATIGVGTERRITENTHVGLGVNVAIGGGPLTLRLRVSRLGQRLSVPIILSRQPSLGMIFGSVIIPGASIATLQYFYFTPRKRRKVAAMLRELREEMKEENAERRKEALEAIELLREQTERKREQERARDGLVILSATYRGTGESVEESEKQATQLDVTIPVQALVIAVAAARGPTRGDKDFTSTLTIPGGRSKAHLMGFYDVLVGSKKELDIEYLFNGRRHKVVFQDRQAVTVPMRSHLIID